MCTHDRPQNADDIQDGTLIYRLDDSTPRTKALQQQELQDAELNKQWAGGCRCCCSRVV